MTPIDTPVELMGDGRWAMGNGQWVSCNLKTPDSIRPSPSPARPPQQTPADNLPGGCLRQMPSRDRQIVKLHRGQSNLYPLLRE